MIILHFHFFRSKLLTQIAFFYKEFVRVVQWITTKEHAEEEGANQGETDVVIHDR